MDLVEREPKFVSMRLTLVLAAGLAAATGACANSPSAAAPEHSPVASVGVPASAVCEDVHSYALAKADPGDPTVAAFLDVLVHADKYPADRQVAIRHAFYVKQTDAVNALAAEADDQDLHAALRTYADGWARLAAAGGAAGSGPVQPDWQPVLDRCPGIQKRIFADLAARGQ